MQRTVGILTLVAAAAALVACGDKQATPTAAQNAASEAVTSAQVAASAATDAASAAVATASAAAEAASAVVNDAASAAGAAASAAGDAANKAAAATTAAAAAVTKAAPAAGGSVDLAAGEKLYKSACFVCHDAGIAGAPKLGNKEEWAPRLAQGNDTLIKHSIDGYTGLTGVMPPRGASTASDEELANAVHFMVSKVQ
ncbi:MAG: cytochrome c5 family protein [Ramlibacter sp.]|nr:cytochrome c5 family protein [Ramlibacter sp.]